VTKSVRYLGSATKLALVIAFMQGGILAGGLIMSAKKEFKRKVATALGGIVISLLGYALVALTPTGQFWFMALSA
jgi:Na+/melibiose symporter-like transporter